MEQERSEPPEQDETFASEDATPAAGAEGAQVDEAGRELAETLEEDGSQGSESA